MSYFFKMPQNLLNAQNDEVTMPNFPVTVSVCTCVWSIRATDYLLSADIDRAEVMEVDKLISKSGHNSIAVEYSRWFLRFATSLPSSMYVPQRSFRERRNFPRI